MTLRKVLLAASNLGLLTTTSNAQNSTAGLADSPTAHCDYIVGAPVKTSSGTVWGHRAPNATAVSEYLGIPFAQPPIGPLRFAAPQRFTSEKTLNAAKAGAICSQSITDVPTFLPQNVYGILSDLSGIGQSPSEDCLTLNVWSKPQTGSRKKPVLVWIYGGGFSLGGTNTSSYSGQFWAETEDVVFVNFNYRLGIFGFSGCPAGTQNVALLDQRMAVEWVRDNIANFGGDPERITVSLARPQVMYPAASEEMSWDSAIPKTNSLTPCDQIFGESAGAASVDYYNYAWTDDPIIAGSIAESGEAGAFGDAAPAAAAKNWYNVTQTLGCGSDETQSAEAVLECMRMTSIDQDMILNATSALAGVGVSSVLSTFGPTVDGKTVFENYTALGESGRFIQKPAIVGNNDYEAGLFILIAAGAGQQLPQSFWDGLTQNTFTCPSNTAAYFRSLHDVPVYRYRYFGMFPNLEIPTSPGRAYHSSEILPMFGASEEISKVDSTWQERMLGSYMRNAWATFARCPSTGVEKVLGWPRYSQATNGTEGLVLLGMNNDTGAQFSARGPYDGTCQLIATRSPQE